MHPGTHVHTESEPLDEIGALPARMTGELTDQGCYRLGRDDVTPVSQPTVKSAWNAYSHPVLWFDLRRGGGESTKELLQIALVYERDKTKQRHREGGSHAMAPLLTENRHTPWPQLEWAISETFCQGFQWLSSSIVNKWQNNTSLLPGDFKSPLWCQRKR